MNTHQKVFFTCAVSLGLVAAAFSATPAPAAKAAPIELPRVTVVGHRMAPEVALEQALVLGHRTAVVIASNSSNTTAVS